MTSRSMSKRARDEDALKQINLAENSIRERRIKFEDLDVVPIPKKGFGIITRKKINKGEFIAYYYGDLKFQDPGSDDIYIFETRRKGKKIWFDASDTKYQSRYFNDGHTQSNMTVKSIIIDLITYPVFFAKHDIQKGEELTYNYGPHPYPWRDDKMGVPVPETRATSRCAEPHSHEMRSEEPHSHEMRRNAEPEPHSHEMRSEEPHSHEMRRNAEPEPHSHEMRSEEPHSHEMRRSEELEPHSHEMRRSEELEPHSHEMKRSEELEPHSYEMRRSEELEPHSHEMRRSEEPEPHSHEMRRNAEPEPHSHEMRRSEELEPHSHEMRRSEELEPHSHEMKRSEELEPHSYEMRRSEELEPHSHEMRRSEEPEPHSHEMRRSEELEPHSYEMRRSAELEPHSHEMRRSEEPEPHSHEMRKSEEPEPHSHEMRRSEEPEPHSHEMRRSEEPEPHSHEMRSEEPEPHSHEMKRSAELEPHSHEMRRSEEPEPHSHEMRSEEPEPHSHEMRRSAELEPHSHEMRRSEEPEPHSHEMRRSEEPEPHSHEMRRSEEPEPHSHEMRKSEELEPHSHEMRNEEPEPHSHEMRKSEEPEPHSHEMRRSEEPEPHSHEMRSEEPEPHSHEMKRSAELEPHSHEMRRSEEPEPHSHEMRRSEEPEPHSHEMRSEEPEPHSHEMKRSAELEPHSHEMRRSEEPEPHSHEMRRSEEPEPHSHEMRKSEELEPHSHEMRSEEPEPHSHEMRRSEEPEPHSHEMRRSEEPEPHSHEMRRSEEPEPHSYEATSITQPHFHFNVDNSGLRKNTECHSTEPEVVSTSEFQREETTVISEGSIIFLTDSTEYTITPLYPNLSSSAPAVDKLNNEHPEDLSVFNVHDQAEIVCSSSHHIKQIEEKSKGESSNSFNHLLLEPSGNGNTYITPDGQEVRLVKVSFPMTNDEVNNPSEPHYVVNSGKESADVDKKIDSKKPSRPCPYCPELKLQSNLKRHLLRKHDEKVKHIKNLSPRKQQLEFKKIRLEGVFLLNKQIKSVNGESSKLHRARKARNDTENLKMCSACHIFLSKKTFRKHKCVNISPKKRSSALDVTPSLTLAVTVQDYLSECISKLQDDEVGALIKETPSLLFLGEKFYLKTNDAKKIEKRRRVNSFLRKMGSIFLYFKKIRPDIDFIDIFDSSNMSTMKEAIFDCVKDGLTQAPMYYHAIKYSITRLGNKFYDEGNELIHNKLQRYSSSFADLYRENFKNLAEDLQREHLKKTKDPASLPNADDIKQIIKHCEETIFQDYSISSYGKNYINIRRCLCTILTLENSRRGSEVSRLSLEEMGSDDWRPTFHKVDDGTSHDILVHTIGKNTKTFVPISISKELVPIMSLFINEKVRKLAGIPISNKYVFASTKSNDHVNGSHEIAETCTNLNLSNSVTATSIRHYVATKFPQSHSLSERDKEIYFKHFGHHEAINSAVYRSRDNQKEKEIASLIRNVVRNEEHQKSSDIIEDNSNNIQIMVSPQVSDRTTDSSLHTPCSQNGVKFVEDLSNKTKTFRRSLFQNSDSSFQCSDEETSEAEEISINQTRSRADKRTRRISSNEESDSFSPIKRDRKYKRWSAEDNDKIREDFKDTIRKDKFRKPSSSVLKKYVRNNTFDYTSAKEAITPVREKHLLRKLYNEQKLYKNKSERVSKDFLSP